MMSAGVSAVYFSSRSGLGRNDPGLGALVVSGFSCARMLTLDGDISESADRLDFNGDDRKLSSKWLVFRFSSEGVAGFDGMTQLGEAQVLCRQVGVEEGRG